MEITKNDISRVIGATVKKNRDQVINALRLSDVNINDDINDRDLLQQTMYQLEDGNNKLIYNLGYVLDKTFDMSSLKLDQQFSQAAGTSPTWWSKNSGSVMTAGVGLLGGLFGKKDTPPPVTPPSGGGNAAMIAMMQQQQNQQSQQTQAENRRREDEASRRSSNMMIFGIVGGIVLIGGVAAIIMTRK